MKKLLPALSLLSLLVTSTSALTVSANYTSADLVPITSSGYTAAGNDIALTLGFAPTSGADLMVVKNTSTYPISGAFDNLTQGQRVILKYGGAIYQYVANYYGGDGNDLVLTAANVTVAGWPIDSTYAAAAVDQTGVLAGKTVISVANGYSHTLALCSDGTLAAWGTNRYGELGNGTTTSSATPVLVDRSGVLAGKTIIAVGTIDSSSSLYSYSASVALCSDGTLATWGNNTRYQLGNGTTKNSTTPTLVDMSGVLADKTVVKIAAGGCHVLALCSDGTLVSWGYNADGQLGIAYGSPNTGVPVHVNQTTELAGKTITAISAGDSHSMALCSDGTLTIWGQGTYGTLGNGGSTSYYMATLVKRSGVLAGKTVVAISAGTNFSLALCSDGSLASWGYNSNGQLGNGTTTNAFEPVLVDQSGVLSGKKITALAAGGLHSLVLNSDNTMVSWGSNSVGQLGTGNKKYATNKNPLSVSQSAVINGNAITSIKAGGNKNLVTLASPFWGLSSLTLSSGSLSPAFLTSQENYAVTVPNAVDNITVKPTTMDQTATIKVNGSALANGSTTSAISLAPGPNVITIQVTSDDRQTSITYTLNVMRTVNLSLTTLENGTISGAGEYVPGSIAQITAIPTPGYRFTGWTGDASGQANPLSITMDGNKTLGAGFTEDLRDFDGDGISNYYEMAIFHTDPTKVDTDGDGLADTFETATSLYDDNSLSPRIGANVSYQFARLQWEGKVKFLGKLPEGLIYDESRAALYGYLSGKPGTYTLKALVPDDTGGTRVLSLSYTIAPFPSKMVGSYQALTMVGPSNQQPLGLLDFTITDGAVCTGSLTVAGNKGVIRFKSQAILSDSATQADVAVSIPATKTQESRWLVFTVSEESALLTGYGTFGEVHGFRLAKKGALGMQDTALSFIFDQGSQDGVSVPAGLGWAVGKLSSASGSISLTGRLGDAQPFKAAVKLSETGQAILWTLPYGDAANSYFCGFLSLRHIVTGESEEMESRQLSWYSEYRPNSKSYPNGFGPLSVSGYVATYAAPLTASAMATSLGLPERKMSCFIEGAGLPDTGATVSLPGALTLADNFVLTATTTSEYPLIPWTGKADKKTGSFTGTLKLPASTATGIIKGNGLVSGVFIQNGKFQPDVGAGLLQIPVSGKKGSYRTAAVHLGE